jgi:Rrf2 family iron-sulfur cluster assembly transcriptional regulator
MRLSTKSRFAVNAMIDLGLRESGGPVALAAIAARQQISLSYLEQLFARLRRSGLVESTRGPGGGYTLGRAAVAVSLADIVNAVEDPAAESESPTASLWASLDGVMLRHMATITLAQLIDEQRQRGVQVEVRPARLASHASIPSRALRSRAPNSVFAFARSLSEG